MTGPPARTGPHAMPRPRRTYSGWLQAIHWSRCAACSEVITEGQWQALAEVPGEGRRWIHEACAYRLGVPPRPERDHDVIWEPGAGRPSDAAAAPGAVVRVLVIGSLSWPRERAVEVRDAIAALARGHRRVLVVHAGRVCPSTGRLAGVDAWTELTATRLGLEVTRLGERPDTHDRAATEARHQVLVDAGADVVLAFPLTRDPVTGAPCEDPVTGDAIARAERAGLAVLTHSAS